MADITYFTKLGCQTAEKQIDLLRQSGHRVEIRDLLTHPWQAAELASYFGDQPLEACFNPNSPRIKSGEINPLAYDREAALAAMLADHLLIRRPLMEANGVRLCGFDPATVHAWVGLGATLYEQNGSEDYTSCSQPSTTPQQCP